MLGLFKRKVAPTLVAPIDGTIVPLEQVSDPVFAQKAMGEGFGVKPVADTVVAPIDGTITTVFKTQHAIGITTAEGLEVLIHIGLDTVELEGKPFTTKVAEGDQVKAGQVLSLADFEAIQAAGKDTVVLVLVTNSADKVKALTIGSGPVKSGETVAALTLKG